MIQKHSCPGAERLTAFLGGTLPDTERATLVEHLAVCDLCRRTLSEAVGVEEALTRRGAAGFLLHVGTGVRPTWSRPTRQAIAWTLATIGTTALLTLPLLDGAETVKGGGERAIERLRSVTRARVTEARLSSGVPYGPVVDAGARDALWQLVSTAGQIRARLAPDPAAPSRHALGVAALLTGNYDEAAFHLGAAAAEAPADGRVLTDAAAAYYERARAGDRADDLPRALSMAERAVQAAPQLKEAWFNRALILARLGLPRQAADAWRTYLSLDGTSVWASEAKTALARIETRPGPAAWDAARLAFIAEGSPAAADRLVRLSPSKSRALFEEAILTQWTSAGDDPAGRLAGALADSLSRLSNDEFPAAVVAWYEEARTHPTAASEASTTVREALGGLRAVSEGRFGDAATVLRQASAALQQLRSPLARRVSIDLAASLYFLGRNEEALALAFAQERESEPLRFPDLTARAARVRGLIAFADGRYAEAQQAYGIVADTYAGMNDLDQAASGHALLANLFFTLGDDRRAWRHRERSAELVTPLASPSVVQGLLLSAAGDALSNREGHAVVAFTSEILGIDSPMRAPTRLQLLASRARAFHLLDRDDDALKQLADAQLTLESVPDEALRARLSGDILQAEAEVLLRTQPQRALAAARQALLQARRGGFDPVRISQLQAQLAEAELELGNEREAEAAAAAGLQSLERAMGPTGGRALAVTDRAWRLYDVGVALAMARGAADKAFAQSERSRARTRTELAAWGAADYELRDISATLTTDAGVLVLHQLDRSLIMWLATAERYWVRQVPLSSTEAARLAGEHLQEIAQAVAHPHATSKLFDVVLRPILPELKGVRRLVVVPSQPFGNVSFAALWNAETGRFAIEERDIAVAPNVGSLMHAAARSAEAGRRELRALIVDPSSADVNDVITPYPAYARLWGTEATPPAVLKAAAGHGVIHVSAPLLANGNHPEQSRFVLTDLPGERFSGTLLASQITTADLTTTRLLVLGLAGDSGRPALENGGILGVARVFLARGVPTVAAQVIAADANATSVVWKDFHQRYAEGTDAVQSLASAQRAAIAAAGRRLGAWASLVMFGAGS